MAPPTPLISEVATQKKLFSGWWRLQVVRPGTIFLTLDASATKIAGAANFEVVLPAGSG